MRSRGLFWRSPSPFKFQSRSHPIRRIDYSLVGASIALSLIGIVAIYSATVDLEMALSSALYSKQALWLVISLVAATVITTIDYRLVERFAIPIYIGCLIALLAVDFVGHSAGGSKRWLMIGPLTVQPSEMMKIGLIIIIARFIDTGSKDRPLTMIDTVAPLILTLIPFLIVARQPDLGTAAIYFVILTGMALIHGVDRTALKYFLALACAIAPVGWFFLKGYQRERILALFNPESDPIGDGYQIIQSKIAVGSGGLFGKGFLEGTQSALNFLPEKHTDFIFAVIAEEAGFVGAAVVFYLFLTLVLRLVDMSNNSSDPFGAMVIMGYAILLSFHFLYNVAMTLGLAPVVGVPLPFISYGGSSMLTNFMALGLVGSISSRRFRGSF